MHTYVIAEAGSCHDNSLPQALHLIEIAAAAHADAVKFQFWSSAARLAERRHAPELTAGYAAYQMPASWLQPLAAQATTRDLDFMCTAYLPEDISVVAPYVRRFKIASFEAGDKAFVMAHEEYARSVVVSTGMMSATDLRYLVNRRDVGGIPIQLLHCVSAYPAPLESLHLHAISTYDLDGFSDHSRDVRVGGWAVAAGAGIIEVHFRSDETARDNPEYPVALSPDELFRYIRDIRAAEGAVGDGRKECQNAERAMARFRVVGA